MIPKRLVNILYNATADPYMCPYDDDPMVMVKSLDDIIHDVCIIGNIYLYADYHLDKATKMFSTHIELEIRSESKAVRFGKLTAVDVRDHVATLYVRSIDGEAFTIGIQTDARDIDKKLIRKKIKELM